jgi:hypothetical protein
MLHLTGLDVTEACDEFWYGEKAQKQRGGC